MLAVSWDAFSGADSTWAGSLGLTELGRVMRRAS